jgi:hypothetical protein
MKRLILVHLLVFTGWALWLTGCSSPPPPVHDYKGAAPVDTTTLEGLREIAKSLDYQVALPDSETGKVLFSEGTSHELFGMPVARGSETRPEQESLKARDGKKYYSEFYLDASGRLIVVGENVNGTATPETKLIYCEAGPLAVIDYNEKGPWRVRVLGRKDGQPFNYAAFKAEMGVDGISLSDPRLHELDPAAIGAYLEKSSGELPKEWTRESVLAHFEKFHKLPSKRGPDQPWIPGEVLLEMAENPPGNPELAAAVNRVVCGPEIHSDQKLRARLLALLKKQVMSGDVEVAKQAIKSYGRLIDSDDDQKFKATLEKMALEGDPLLRLAVIETLIQEKGGLKNPRVLEVVLQGMASDSEIVASNCADHLDRLWRGDIRDGKVYPHPRSIAATRQGLSSPYPVVRGFCVRKLVELTPDKERAALLSEVTSLLADKNEFVRTGTAMALGEIGSEKSVPALVALMKNDKGTGYCSYRVEKGLEHLSNEQKIYVSNGFEHLDSKSSLECYVLAFERCAPGYQAPGGDVHQRRAAALAWWDEED